MNTHHCLKLPRTSAYLFLVSGILLIVWSAAIQAQTTSSQDPPELSTLQINWKKARQQATDPIDRKYGEALEALKLRFTKAGNLKSALAVDAEINKFKQSGTSPVEAAPHTKNAENDLEKFMNTGTWQWFSNKDWSGNPVLNIEFQRGGKTSWQYAPKWEVIGQNQIKVWRNEKDFWVFEIDPDQKRGKTVQKEGALPDEKCIRLAK